MATPPPLSFATDKAAVLAIIRAKSCKEANYIDKNAKNYNDLLELVFEYARTFDCDTTGYLESMLTAISSDSILTDNGVYFNKTGTDVTNARLIVNSTYSGTVTISTGTVVSGVMITRNSNIAHILVTGTTVLNQLTISGASIVALLEVTVNSEVDILQVRACDANISTLTKIKSGSIINYKGIDEDAVYGGVECPPPTVFCTDEVTGPASSLIDNQGFKIEWTLPTNSQGIRIKYRAEGEENYTVGGSNVSIATGNLSATLTGLSANTKYEVLIQNQCNTPNAFSEGTIIEVTTTNTAP